MKQLSGLFVLLVATLVLNTSMLASAQGTGTVTQLGLDNYASIYQELLSEAIIMQLGNENQASVEQEGTAHLAGVGQVGQKNEIEVLQVEKKDLVFSIQFGFKNNAMICQIHPSVISTSQNLSDKDVFTYQSGLFNKLDVMQTGDDHTTSVYQVDNNNEVFIVQEQHLLGVGANATFLVQAGVGNWAVIQQAGANQLARTLQIGDDNSSFIDQKGIDNTASVIQTGNNNSATINQG